MLLYQGSCMKKQLPGVLEVMACSEYAHFAGNVRKAELHSMHTLGCVVPDLELWALKRSECTDMPVSLTQTDFTAFAASNMATLQPPEERQKLRKQQECEDLEYKVLDVWTKAAALELAVQQGRLAELEAQHQSQQRRASGNAGRLQTAADLAAGTSICSLQPATVHDQYGMTDCTSANTVKGVTGQAAKQLINTKLFKHKTVREVWVEWHYGTAEQVSVKSRLRQDSAGRLSLYGKGYARYVNKELQQQRDLPEAIDLSPMSKAFQKKWRCKWLKAWQSNLSSQMLHQTAISMLST